jgi:hypothetical protein
MDVGRHSLLEVQWLGSEADHPLSSIAKHKNKWSYTFSPLICLIDVTSDFTFTSEGNGYSVNINSNNSLVKKYAY